MQRNSPRRQSARVKDLAGDIYALDTCETAKIDNDVLLRIKKCLDLANHSETPQAEAQAALRVAHKWMAKHNVQQADVYTEAISGGDTSQVAGQSIVTISTNKKVVIDEHRTNKVASAITNFFDCDAYITTRRTSIDWVFYGIAINTAAAAMAFEMVINKIQHWSFQRRKGNKNSYRLGVADGLQKMVIEEKQSEKEKVERQEKADIAAREAQERVQRDREIERRRHEAIDEGSNKTLSPEECIAKCQEDGHLLMGLAMLVIKMQQGPETEGNSHSVVKHPDNIIPVTRSSHIDYQTATMDSEDEVEDVSVDYSNMGQVGVKTDEDTRSGGEHDSTVQDSGGEDIDDQNDEDYIEEDHGGGDRDYVTVVDQFCTFKAEDEDEIPDPAVDLKEEIQQNMPSQIYSNSQGEVSSHLETSRTAEVLQDIYKTEEDEMSVAWRSIGALVRYHDSAKKIAEEYLKEKDIKLGKGSPFTFKVRDRHSYGDGEIDSRKIDLKRRRIDEGNGESEQEVTKRRRGRSTTPVR